MTHRTSERVLIRASAGTGKTFRLSNHYLSQLLRGSRPESILATTFTRKAAGEIQERLFTRLMDAASSEKQARALSKFVGAEVTTDRALSELHSLARQMHRIRVGTLDSFYSQLATAYSLEFGLPSDWRILDDVDVLPLKLRSLDDVLTSSSADETVVLLHLLDKGDTKRRVVGQMLDAVNNFHEVFVDAGKEYSPWDQIPDPRPLDGGALAAVADVIDDEGRKFPDKRGVEAFAKVVSAVGLEDWKSVVSASVVGNALSGVCAYYKKPFSEPLTEALKTLAYHAGQCLLIELRTQNQATFELLDKFDRSYESRKLESGGLSFTDVTRFLASAIERVDAGQVGFRLDGDLEHLLLDEFQDTSLPQWGILRPLAHQVTARPDGSVFCVGDLKQAIYGWRGGVAAIFDRVEEELGIDPESMDTSFRSSPVVIDAVNKLFGNLGDYGDYSPPERRAIDNWGNQFQAHQSALNLPGYVEIRSTPKPESGNSKFGSDIRRWTAAFVRDLHRQHPGRTIGVLTRKNDVASEMVAYLRGLGINASDEGREKLTDSAAVQLICSLLTMAEQPHDTVARFHLASSPLTLPTGLSSHRDDAAAAKLSDLLREQLMAEGFGAVIHHWASLLVPECGPRDIARLRQLNALADEYDRTSSPTAGEFLRVVRESKANDPLPGLVRVMTVHQSKGLEFDIVVLTELDDPCYRLDRSGYVAARPSADRPPDRIIRYRGKDEVAVFPEPVKEVFAEAATAEMAEALCRFYVAVTRAQSALYFLVSPTGKNPPEATRFADLVRFVLCDGQRLDEDTVVTSFGDPDWDKAVTRETVQPTVRRAEIRLRPSVDERAVRSVAPSSLAASETTSSRIVRLEKVGRGNAAMRGTLVHRWLEEIEWFETTPPSDAGRRNELGNWLDFPSALVAEENSRFESMLNSPIAARILAKANYGNLPENERRDEPSVVLRELPFSIQLASQWIAGTIDRLVLFGPKGRPSGAEIIDWKTDFVRDDDHLAEKVSHYGAQLGAYADAVVALFGVEREAISARLVFLTYDRDIVLPVGKIARESDAASRHAAVQPTLFD